MTGATPPPPPPGGTPPGAPPPPPPGAMPPTPPGAPGFGNRVQSGGGTNGMATASLVLGIVSIPLCFIFIPSVLAVVFGFIGLGQIKNNPGQGGRGQAITGLILGGISLVILVVAFIAVGTADFNLDTR